MPDRQSLSRFRKILTEKRDEVHRRLVLSKDQVRGLGRSELKDEGDRAHASITHEMSAVQQAQAQALLAHINSALDRIAGGTFGECVSCGQEIGEKRLEAIPWVRYCITCQELLDAKK